jgi:hypothetical protein
MYRLLATNFVSFRSSCAAKVLEVAQIDCAVYSWMLRPAVCIDLGRRFTTMLFSKNLHPLYGLEPWIKHAHGEGAHNWFISARDLFWLGVTNLGLVLWMAPRLMCFDVSFGSFTDMVTSVGSLAAIDSFNVWAWFPHGGDLQVPDKTLYIPYF